MGEPGGITEREPAVYAAEVGRRLRDIRRQQGLSLQAVEEASDREFKASVLGAYERGERVISVLRLQRLAAIYSVPVDQLLPRGAPAPSLDGGTGALDQAPVTIELARLEHLDGVEGSLIRRYVTMLQLQRGDYNGRVITVRNEDVRALARMFERDEPGMRRLLDELGIRM